jgi:hypothetical protein
VIAPVQAVSSIVVSRSTPLKVITALRAAGVSVHKAG